MTYRPAVMTVVKIRQVAPLYVSNIWKNTE